MSIFNYKYENFVAVPTGNDTQLRIYDKNNNLVYTFDPNVAYFYTKNNYVNIQVEDEKDINLDFENENEALRAITKLNQYKKLFTKKEQEEVPYYTKDELSGGTLDWRYYTKVEALATFYTQTQVDNISGLTYYYTKDEIDNISGLTYYYTKDEIDNIITSGFTGLTLEDLSNVTIINPQYQDVLIWSPASMSWTNTALTNLTYNKNELFTTAQTYELFIPLSGSNEITGDLSPLTDGGAKLGGPGHQWESLYVSGGTIYLDLRPLRISSSASSHLEWDGDLLATQSLVLSLIENSGLTSLSALTDTQINNLQSEDFLIYQGGFWRNQPLSNYIYTTGETYTKTEVDNLISGTTSILSLSALTDVYFSGSPNNGDFLVYNGVAWSNSAVSYYTQSEVNNFLGNYYKKNEVYNTGQTYTQTYINNNFYTKSELQTSGQALVHWENITNNPYEVKVGTFNSVSVNLDRISTGLTNAVIWQYSAFNLDIQGFKVGEIYANWDGTVLEYAETNTKGVGAALTDFENNYGVRMVGGFVEFYLNLTSGSGNWRVKLIRIEL
jgi:hypothetical protein